MEARCLFTKPAQCRNPEDCHSNIMYKEPTRCNFGQYSFLLTTASTLYMFGRFLRPSSGVLKTVVAAIVACHWSG